MHDNSSSHVQIWDVSLSLTRVRASSFDWEETLQSSIFFFMLTSGGAPPLHLILLPLYIHYCTCRIFTIQHDVKLYQVLCTTLHYRKRRVVVHTL